MGLKCLLGHDYSAPEIERERVEDGDEVVTTLREVQTCARCGETRVVSENTEVTTMARLTAEAEALDESATRTETLSGEPSPDGLSTDDSPTPDSSTPDSSVDDSSTPDSPTPDSSTPDSPPAEPASPEAAPSTETEPTASDGRRASTATPETDDGVEFIEETTPNAAAGHPATEDPLTADEAPTMNEARTDEPPGDRSDPADDGAEILDSEPAADDSTTTTAGVSQGDGRERGAWPAVDAPADASTETDGEHRSWPTPDAEDEGYAASTASNADESDDEPVAYVGGPAAEAPATAQSDTATGLVRSHDQRAAPAEEAQLRGPTEYYCPACEMTTDTEGSSLRAGDVCPACRGGYVAERSQ